jgi:ABC-type sugar transport system permease subunit
MSARRGWESPLTPYLLLAPFGGVFLLFTAYPLVQSLGLAFQQTYGPATSRFVYLENFRNLLADPLFWTATFNTLVYSACSLLIQLPLSLGLALLLNRPGIRGRMLFRLAFFSPSLVGIAFVAILFTPLLAKNTGLVNVALNDLLPHIGLSWDVEYAWLTDHVMAALVVASLWMYVGFNMVYFLAALQNVDQSLVEAAEIDGAGVWGKFRYVTLPAIRNVGSFVVLLSLIGSFQLFELPYVMMNFSGGPQNRGLTVVTYLYQVGFEGVDLGYASAIGWCLAAALLLLALLQRQLTRKFED